ncbi:MAG: GAF domain-containing protein [Bacilli bacterium]|nr:GAF domain-containing protein [Bacilli bacterium]
MELLLKQIESIIDKDIPLVSNLSNVSAVLNQLENINWCGFYLRKDNNLYLGPFQGDVACTIIPLGKGVCGTSALNKQTLVVPNVNEFPGHIACSSLSKSEIVVPIIKDKDVKGVIDIDAPIYDRFKNEEKILLEKVAILLSELF